MGTRSAIGIKHGSVIKAVYCHYDGYLEHNGLILANYYTDSIKVNRLISMGDMSTLGASIGEIQEFNVYREVDTLAETWCKFYGRDRGEANIDFRTFQNEQDYLDNFGAGVEFFYLYDQGQWTYSTGGVFEELSPDLIVSLLKQEA